PANFNNSSGPSPFTIPAHPRSIDQKRLMSVHLETADAGPLFTSLPFAIPMIKYIFRSKCDRKQKIQQNRQREYSRIGS
ncbi:MAG: hypothetical protein LUC88_01940, partial [Prevotella sp.]|nr:hypothetical protein [Prevotella sp.]